MRIHVYIHKRHRLQNKNLIFPCQHIFFPHAALSTVLITSRWRQGNVGFIATCGCGVCNAKGFQMHPANLLGTIPKPTFWCVKYIFAIANSHHNLWLENHWVSRPKPETGCAKNLALQKAKPSPWRFSGWFTDKKSSGTLEGKGDEPALESESLDHFQVNHSLNFRRVWDDMRWATFWTLLGCYGGATFTCQGDWHIPPVAKKTHLGRGHVTF